jgi:hypothetical protein
MSSRFGLSGLIITSVLLAASFVVVRFAPPPTALAVPMATQPPVCPIIAQSTVPAAEHGKVHWHATTEAALAAAKVSQKPVLVFHMMGRLDHQFC